MIPASIYAREGAQAVEAEAVETAEEFGVIDTKSTDIAAPTYDHGVKEAQKMNQSDKASKSHYHGEDVYNTTNLDKGIWTQLALAYAIHKSFIFVRVPLTAAVLPKVVKTLRGWGWNIGKRRPKAPTDITND